MTETTLPLFATPRDAYNDIRNFLAGRHVGATRDEALLEEVLKCLFVLMWRRTATSQIDEKSDLQLAKWYREAFQDVRGQFQGIFEQGDEILLGPEAIAHVHQQLARVNLFDDDSDPVGDLFQAFIGSAVRGAEGQFFTPATAVRFLVDAVELKPGERVIDPACGPGGFLALTAKRKLAAGTPAEDVARQVVGIEKDAYLARMARIHLAVTLRSNPKIFCADSLSWTPANGTPLELDLAPTFDVVLANPPFGAKIMAASEAALRSFDLGFKWKLDKKTGEFARTSVPGKRVPPQILFVERCLSLLADGGRMGIVVPESLVSGAAYRHVVAYLRGRASIEAVVGMPEDLFKTSGKGGTHTKTCLIVAQRRTSSATAAVAESTFMAEAKWCGHDSRGRNIPNDDVPPILHNFREWRKGRGTPETTLGYTVSADDISENVLAPRYYDPAVATRLRELRATHDLVVFGDLVRQKVLSLSTGHEVGKLAYGTGAVPFVRTSDISNWEIKLDPKHGVSDEIFERLRPKQDVRAGDILMVRDGTYLIGTCALITRYDERIIYQSHIYKIRVQRPDRVSPFLLLALLSSPIVQRQIKAKRFTQDIIDSLGDRINELVLPIPKDPKLREKVSAKVEKAINERIEARELAREACLEVVGFDPAGQVPPELTIDE